MFGRTLNVFKTVRFGVAGFATAAQSANKSAWAPYVIGASVTIAAIMASQPAHNTPKPSDSLAKPGKVDMVIGTQWGDEGKGKLVDIVSQKYDICARVAGGANAGHTIVVDGKKYKFHLIPSAILHSHVQCVVGNGVVVHLKSMLQELDTLTKMDVDYKGRILISDRAHLVFDFHQAIDGYNENALGASKIGTTLKGIGPAYGNKVLRNGLRVGDLKDMAYFESRLRSLAQYVERAYPGLKVDVNAELAYYNSIRDRVLSMVGDTVYVTNDALRSGKKILVEGANATMIDLDFGTYPYVTSSSPTSGGACTGLGIPPPSISGIIGIVKAYCSRVGEGPFPTELSQPLYDILQKKGGEYGTTTGRARRVGWLDIPQLRYALLLNGVNVINLTKLDVLTGFEEVKVGVRYRLNGKVVEHMPANINEFSKVEVEYESLPGWKEDISKCRRYSDLPLNCRRYIERVEQLMGMKVRFIGVGADRGDIIDRGDL